MTPKLCTYNNCCSNLHIRIKNIVVLLCHKTSEPKTKLLKLLKSSFKLSQYTHIYSHSVHKRNKTFKSIFAHMVEKCCLIRIYYNKMHFHAQNHYVAYRQLFFVPTQIISCVSKYSFRTSHSNYHKPL